MQPPAPQPPGTDPAAVTAALWRRAEGVLVSGLLTPSQGAFHYPGGTFPLLAERGDGCTLFDTTGRAYVDWIMGYGPVILGYRHPAVEQAIREQLAAGPLLSLLHPLEIELASTIRELVPCAERVAFGKNGSDVLGAAVRVARAVTQREGVLVCGYHGFHDWYLASVPGCLGVPEALRWLVRAFPFNDLEAVAALFERHGDDIAAVVLEPAGGALPQPGFLEGLRALCTRHRAVLVFDEVLTAFRLAPGGAQQAFGVTPDLACLGKAMGNGMPLSALVGKTELMEALHHVGYGLTFRGETLSLAAARACLRVIAEQDVCAHLATIGRQLRAILAQACRSTGVEASLTGPEARLTVTVGRAGRLLPLGLQTWCVQECVRRGVLTTGNFLPSLAHGDAALAATAAAFRGALAAVASAIAAADLQPFLHMPPLHSFFADGVAQEA